MSYGTPRVSRSRASRKAGTLRSVADRARPPATATRTCTSPAGVSSETTVSGSVTATIPVSTSTVATPIVPFPHIGRHPETSTNSTPQSASSRRGGRGDPGGRPRGPPEEPAGAHRALKVREEPRRHVGPAQRQQPLVERARLGEP